MDCVDHFDGYVVLIAFRMFRVGGFRVPGSRAERIQSSGLSPRLGGRLRCALVAPLPFQDIQRHHVDAEEPPKGMQVGGHIVTRHRVPNVTRYLLLGWEFHAFIVFL